MVPTVFKFDNEVNVVFEVAVMLLAVVAVVAVVAFPKKLGAVISALNVFAPAIVCVPAVKIPPFVASAGVSVKAVPLIVAPFASDVPAMAVMVFTPAVIPTVPAAVNRPLPSTVNVGIAVVDP